MGCECIVDIKKNDEKNDILMKIEKRFKKQINYERERQLLDSYFEENNSDYYNFSRQLFQYINETRRNPCKFIQFLNTNFSQQIIPHHPPIIFCDNLGKEITIEINKFINLFNNINSLSCTNMLQIKWDEELHKISSRFLELMTEVGYKDALYEMNLNKVICSALKGNHKCTETVITGLFDLNISTTLILLDQTMFSVLMKMNIHSGSIACISHKNTFYFMLILVEKVEENSEISLDDPMFNYIGFKDQINKAFILHKGERRNLVRFLMKDETIIEEFINY